jgi:predicted TIM-barrel fold metal-dependent hydrolase
LRLVLAGVFDRFPDLQLITGHWGEVVLFYLDVSKVWRDRPSWHGRCRTISATMYR